ncbi:MAG: hypothetical protein M3O41_00510 [Pseudomonadota bacterium]|nr:hypothetical protein [Pseudomonadota bacterium]
MSTERRLTRNAVKCLACGKVIESKHRHDYVTCGCPNSAMVDGGLAYERAGAMNWDLVEPLYEYADETESS